MTNSTEDFFFSKAIRPHMQLVGVFVATMLVIFGGKLVALFGWVELEPLFPWMTTASFLLFFAMINSVLSLSSTDMSKYWTESMMSFIALAVAGGIVAWWVSGTKLADAASYKWIFMVLTFGYLVFMSIMRFMRKIVEFAQEEDRKIDQMK